MEPIVRAGWQGALAGAAATTTMTTYMWLAQQSGLYRKELPPTKVTRSVARTLGIEPDTSETQTLLTGALHWAFGMLGGAMFGVIVHKIARLPRWLGGIVFGLLVWGISYMGWVPALGILPPPWNQRPRHGSMPLVAHVIYGATLGLLIGRWERR